VPNDFSAHSPDVQTVGRIYRINGGPGDGQWFWVLNGLVGGEWQNVSGRAMSRNAAAIQVARALAYVLMQ
jgi:hypothetical protein